MRAGPCPLYPPKQRRRSLERAGGNAFVASGRWCERELDFVLGTVLSLRSVKLTAVPDYI